MVLHGTWWASSESVSWFPRAGLLAARLCCDLSFRPAEARAPGNAGWLVSVDRLLPSCTPGVKLLVLSSQGQCPAPRRPGTEKLLRVLSVGARHSEAI